MVLVQVVEHSYSTRHISLVGKIHRDSQGRRVASCFPKGTRQSPLLTRVIIRDSKLSMEQCQFHCSYLCLQLKAWTYFATSTEFITDLPCFEGHLLVTCTQVWLMLSKFHLFLILCQSGFSVFNVLVFQNPSAPKSVLVSVLQRNNQMYGCKRRVITRNCLPQL